MMRDLVGYAGNPPDAKWPGDARVAISLVVNFEEGSEQAIADGDAANEHGHAEVPAGSAFGDRRDLAMESMYEYGTRAGYWRVLDILDQADVKCTFFACGVALQRNREAAAEMRRRGHDVISHGWRWEDVALLSRDEERDHIRRAIEAIEETTGERPLGWYCRSRPSVHTRELILEEGGFLYDCDAYNDDLPYWTRSGDRDHLVIPYSLVDNDGRFGRGIFSAPDDFRDHLIYAFDRLYKEGLTRPKMLNVGMHLRLIGQPARARALREFIAYAQSFPNVWFARRIDIARHWMEHHPCQN